MSGSVGIREEFSVSVREEEFSVSVREADTPQA